MTRCETCHEQSAVWLDIIARTGAIPAIHIEHMRDCLEFKQALHHAFKARLKQEGESLAVSYLDEAFQYITRLDVARYMDNLRWNLKDFSEALRLLIDEHRKLCRHCEEAFQKSWGMTKFHTRHTHNLYVVYQMKFYLIKLLAVLSIIDLLVTLTVGIVLSSITFDYSQPSQSVGKNASVLPLNPHFAQWNALNDTLTPIFFVTLCLSPLLILVFILMHADLPPYPPLPKSLLGVNRFHS